MDIFELSRNYWAKAPDNGAKPFHHALYFYILNRANALMWKPTFGIPTGYTLEMMGTTSYKTYIQALEDLERFGLIEIVERAKNQHTSNVIALVEFTKATTEADTKADSKQLPTHIQHNNTVKTIENRKDKKTLPVYTDEFLKFWNIYPRKEAKPDAFKAFKKIKADELDKILRHVPMFCHGKEPQFIPHPASYLNKRRWEDEGIKTNEPAAPFRRIITADTEL
jgi:hypothetical protein